MSGTPEQQEKAHNLWQSARNIYRASKHLEALMDNLAEQIEKTRFGGDKVEFDKPSYDGVEWININKAIYGSVLRKPDGRKRKFQQTGTISLHLMLCAAEPEKVDVDWPWRKQPSLVVGWACKKTPPLSWDNFYLSKEEIDPVDLDEDSIKYITPRSQTTWQWIEEDSPGVDVRLFALPIFSLREERDLERHVVKPLKFLFEGKIEADAFPEDSPVFHTGASAEL